MKRNAKVLLFRMTSSKIAVWGPQGQAPDSGLGDSVRETGCHYEGMPSRAQTLREGKPGSPLPRRAENVAGGLLSDDVTGSKRFRLLCRNETQHCGETWNTDQVDDALFNEVVTESICACAVHIIKILTDKVTQAVTCPISASF